ncbi:MAG: 23S rRNA (adenine(2503)-C(2))-methyltransferase RlmN [Candidatus Omnitrophica bacterium]|nr:23S rRNA (adenine(2503)-C(2))-methyltransferase RlmN [Candidatus Omnitrophota bacterium]
MGTDNSPKRNIKELTLDELKDVLVSLGQPAFRARQVLTWVYKKTAVDFDQMSDLPLALREILKEKFYLFDLKVQKVQESRDATKKILFSLKDSDYIEAVIIPAESRVTGCVSTQVGCKYSCRFCASGVSGFKRDLGFAEILDEVVYLKNNSFEGKLTHLVFMGMGEPLDNYDNVLKAIRIINAEYGFNIGARRITVSTCGIVPAINRLSGEGLQIELSVSLHAADDKTRSALMPVNKKYPLSELVTACREYVDKTNRQVTFEYVLIKNMNSDLPSAQKLVTMLKGMNCKINLIPCNYIKELGIEPPNKLEILFFKDSLTKAGLNVTLRKPRGQDIESACGQLRLRHVKNQS